MRSAPPRSRRYDHQEQGWCTSTRGRRARVDARESFTRMVITTMPVTRENILFHELIGLPVRVSGSPNKDLVGLSGIVIDETMNTIVVEQQAPVVPGRETPPRKRVLKKHQEFTFTLPSGDEVAVPGVLLVGRPWERLKHVGKRQYRL